MENYFNRIVELFVKSDVSPSLQADFYRWLADGKFSREKEEALRNLWEKMVENRNIESETSANTWHSLANVHKRIRERQGNAHRKLLRFWQISAACLVIAFISTFYFTHTTKREAADLIEQYVPVAGMGHLTLPDGTEVQMNSTATLLYPEQFSGKNRSVYLIGEANFKVARNEKMPFIVKSNDFQVTALGTEFNLRAYPGDSTLSATLLSGSVEVKFNNLTSAQILKPNEQLTYNIFTKTESIHHPDISEVTAWQRGELIFKSTSLGEIITVLERRYPYSFVYALSSLKEDKYTFRFKENTSLTEVMDIIVRVSGSIKYRIEDDKCYITSI
ncbi:MAG: FecR domain-containing protein [Proteiniphilum sp.]